MSLLSMLLLVEYWRWQGPYGEVGHVCLDFIVNPIQDDHEVRPLTGTLPCLVLDPEPIVTKKSEICSKKNLKEKRAAKIYLKFRLFLKLCVKTEIL